MEEDIVGHCGLRDVTGAKAATQDHHVLEQHAAFDDGMLVVIGKEVRNAVRERKAALFVERERQRAFARSDRQDLKAPCVLAVQKLDDGAPVSLALILRPHGQVLDFEHAVALVRDDAFGAHEPVLFEHPDRAALDGPIEHPPIFVGEQQQVQVCLFAGDDLAHCHDTLPFSVRTLDEPARLQPGQSDPVRQPIYETQGHIEELVVLFEIAPAQANTQGRIEFGGKHGKAFPRPPRACADLRREDAALALDKKSTSACAPDAQ